MEGWNATGIMGELPIIQAMLIKPEIESRSWHKNINCMLENIFSTSFLDSRKSQGHSDRLLNQGHKVVTQEHGWQLNSGHECASLNWSIYLSLIVFFSFCQGVVCCEDDDAFNIALLSISSRNRTMASTATHSMEPWTRIRSERNKNKIVPAEVAIIIMTS